MTSKLTQLSTSLILQHRPLTKIALDNKIRAIISQFHPYERHFTLTLHENTLDRIYTINPIEKEYSKIKHPFPVIKPSIMMEDKITIDNFSLINKQTDKYIYIYNKVTQWLENLNYDCKKNKTNII